MHQQLEEQTPLFLQTNRRRQNGENNHNRTVETLLCPCFSTKIRPNPSKTLRDSTHLSRLRAEISVPGTSRILRYSGSTEIRRTTLRFRVYSTRVLWGNFQCAFTLYLCFTTSSVSQLRPRLSSELLGACAYALHLSRDRGPSI
jgi:hypothetical protein